MQISRGVVAAILMSGITMPAVAQMPSAGGMMMNPPQIVVTSVGQTRVVPDRATIVLGVQSRAATAQAAGTANARRQRAIIDTLRAMGLTSEQISTQGYQVYPETRYDRETQTTKVVGYVVSNSVRVELRKIDDVGRVIDAGLAKGANQVSSLELYPSNVDEARRKAQAEAVERAKADAEGLAKAAGGTIDGLLEIVSMDVGEPPIIRRAMGMAAEARVADATPIEAGSEMFRVTVTTRWKYAPAR